VADYYLVRQSRGPEWDHDVLRREQPGWDEHASFMDGLVDDGFIVLGGPIGDGDGDDTLLVVDADDEAAVRERLDADPWRNTLLTYRSIEPWSVWLGG
jgi:uncharacterized protein YciI